MTLSVLRALHAILGDALDDIQRVYTPEQDDQPPRSPSEGSSEAAHTSYASPPPSPSTPGPPLDFPSPSAPYDPNDPAEQLTADPVVVRAINRIIAAAGQMAITVQAPFYALCDASMGYHLPSCLRLLEASHTVEILREAGPDGLHVDIISERNGVETGKLAHVLRLLATHHFVLERSPNVFAINRISSLIDSGKSFEELKRWEKEGRPEMKYHNTNGVAAFIGMCADELFKSSAYLTEAYLLAREDPRRPPFSHAFRTDAGFFAWLEGEGRADGIDGGGGGLEFKLDHNSKRDGEREGKRSAEAVQNWNQFRLERFGTAMSGTGSWEAPGAVFNGFDWRALPRGSIIVDVGGGIGSTSMLLAKAFSRSATGAASPLPSPPMSPLGGRAERGLLEEGDEDLGFKFVIQDREVVVEMGEKAWRAKCPELLDSATARFQVHDFFTEQPIKNAAVFFLRVILHDWPDAQARLILLRLREAATPQTKLVLGDFVLPLACVDEDAAGEGDAGVGVGVLEGVEGAESMLAPAPLLANLGKASANAYWMDLTMQVTFDAQERTLRETAALALSAGWRVIKVTRAPGSLFGHIVAVPAPIPMQRRARAGSGSAFFDVPGASSAGTKEGQPVEDSGRRLKGELDVMERASSRCGTPTFGSRTDLPSMQEAMARFGGGIVRPRAPGLMGKPSRPPTMIRPGILKQPAVITTSSTVPPVKKKKPSPLSFPPALSSSPSPASPRPLASPRLSQPPSPITRRMSQAQLHRPPSQQGSPSPVPPIPRQAPPSPLSPRHPHSAPLRTLNRRASHAQLSHHGSSLSMTAAIPPSPSLPPEYAPASPRHQALSRTKSHAQLYQSARPQAGQSSSIPVRQSYDPLPPKPQSLSLSYAPRSPPPPIPPASTPRCASIARRSSYAQLPQTSLRTRSGSVVGLSIGGAGIGGAISMASLLGGARGAGGGALNFGDAVPRRGGEAEPKPGGNVLAAAARIERGGVLSRPDSP